MGCRPNNIPHWLFLWVPPPLFSSGVCVGGVCVCGCVLCVCVSVGGCVVCVCVVGVCVCGGVCFVCVCVCVCVCVFVNLCLWMQVHSALKDTLPHLDPFLQVDRSEERRVGKECRSLLSP